jgi:tetratricopeptide (TPR) repeat protein
MMIDEQRYNNMLSENIALLLKVSNSQKERQVNIEKGLKFFNDSLRDPSFFDVSLKFFKKAEGDDDTDYFVLDKIGLIYLSSKEHKNYDEAIKYFTKAVRFSKVDTHPSSIRLANILVGDFTKPLNEQNASIDYIKYLTGQSLLWISVAYYEQAKFPESIKFAQEAFQIAPTLLDAGFHLAKSLAANNQNTKAADVLYPIIKQNRNYSLKTLSDIDLAPKTEVKNTLEKLRQEVFNEASSRLNECKTKCSSNSNGKDLLNVIERLTNHKSFLACKKAIDLLNKKNSYTFKEAIERNDSGKWNALIKPMTFSFSLAELIDYEILLKEKSNIVMSIIEKKGTIARLSGELNSTKSNLEKANSDLESSSSENKEFGWALLGGIALLIVGYIFFHNGDTDSIGGFFSGFLGIVLLLCGIGVTLMALPVFIGTGVSAASDGDKKSKISNEQQNLRSKISQLENEVRQLENS